MEVSQGPVILFEEEHLILSFEQVTWSHNQPMVHWGKRQSVFFIFSGNFWIRSET